LAKQNRQVLENALKTNRLYKQWMAQKNVIGTHHLTRLSRRYIRPATKIASQAEEYILDGQRKYVLA